jgi:hypothetical protein
MTPKDLPQCPRCGRPRVLQKRSGVCTSCEVVILNERSHIRPIPWNFIIGVSLVVTLVIILAASMAGYMVLWSYVGRDCIYKPTNEHVTVISYVQRQWPPCYLVRRQNGETMMVLRSDLAPQ